MHWYSIALFLAFFSWTKAAQTQPLSAFASCQIDLLHQMGWQFSWADSIAEVSEKEWPDHESIQNCGTATSKIVLSKSSSHQNLEIINAAWRSEKTLCLFQSQVASAAKKSLNRLSSSYFHFFRMPWHQNNISPGSLMFWSKNNCGNTDCYTPNVESSSMAVQELYRGFYFTDCAIGQQISELLIVKEVFGPELFDKYFAPSEIFLGESIDLLKNSQSFLRKDSARVRLNAWGLGVARLGAKGFSGISGFIGAIDGNDELIRDEINQNQNFVIVTTSEAASNAFLERKGTRFYNDLLKRIWKLTLKLDRSQKDRILQLAKNKSIPKISAADFIGYRGEQTTQIVYNSTIIEVIGLLMEPFLNETFVYVHPTGIQSIAWHVIRSSIKNPKVPYELGFYSNSMQGEVFERWILSKIDQCKNQ